MNRRRFLKNTMLAGAGATLGASIPVDLRALSRKPLFSAIGVTASIGRAAELRECMIDYVVENTAGFLMPDEPEEKFEAKLAEAKEAVLPVLGTNGFLRDPRLRCTGPDADHPAVLAFAETAFRRLRRAGGEFIVFGSAGARRIPDDFPKEKADEQFTGLLKAMAPLAAAQNITVAVELLQKRECNYLTRLGEVAAIVGAVDHPNIRALADIYHMTNMDDTPADLAQAMPWVYMVEIAEKNSRTAPGVEGENFRPWFKVLEDHDYAGRITIEGKWTTAQLRNAVTEIIRQSAAG